MQIGGRERITHPAKVVFETQRDKMPDMLPFLPAVEAIDVVERSEEPGVVHLVNHWKGSPNDVPRPIRPFVSEDMLRWKDFADWFEEDLHCLWRLETFVGANIFDCSGRTSFTADGEQACYMTIEADLNVHPDKVPGVPRLLARSVRGTIEKFIANMLTPNLTAMSKGVQDYLDSLKK